ncbi:MAG: T9SS type A sorting domain-containing protein [Bacteroidales bacterium]|nr:T9SS type A sorting domain-containing protein [Bacteroidales bacterium]
MKKFYILISLVVGLSSFSQAQSARLVLIEEATNASCGPCASQNPAFDILLNQNRDKLTAIKYHWYYPGYDPMYNHNTVENLARVAYYGINGVPTACIDGDIPNGPTFGYPGGPHGYTQALIDEYAAIPSPFNIFLSHRISPDQDSIYIDMMIEATAAVSGNLLAHMVVVEKHINFSSPPGTNGEKNFLDVMKKMVPDQDGTPLPSSFQAGDYLILQGSWHLQNIYDMDEIGVVGFIQNNSSKEVHQAGNSSTDPLTPLYNNEVNLIGISNINETNCLGTIEPKITIRNNGANLLTNVDIYYRINDETTYIYPWSGNLDFMESTELILPQTGFEILDENNFYTYSVNPNGSPDEYTKNDTLIQMFERAMITPLTVKLMMRTDANPQQNTWEILNSVGEVVYSGGPYANPTTIYQETFQLEDVECYIFKIYDSGGDGLVIPGFYALYYGSNNYIKTGTTFGSIDSAYFEVNTQVGITEKEGETNVNIYPNPATSYINLYFFIFNNEKVSIAVYDLVGRQVKTEKRGLLSAGPQAIRIAIEDIKPGLYLVQTTIGGKIHTQKLTIVQ